MTESKKQTAEIIPFPGRARSNRNGQTSGVKQIWDRLPPGVTYTECGSGWYHDAAVQEDSRSWTGR